MPYINVMRKSKYDKQTLSMVVRKAKSIADVLRHFGLSPSGGMHRLMKSRIVEHGLDVSHFTGSRWSKGRKLGENYFRTQKPLESILVCNSVYPSSRLRKRLINAGHKKDCCECCGIKRWRGVPLVLELHHKDNNCNNNLLNNLMILCPNCHTAIHAT
jgi:hypothetical protein